MGRRAVPFAEATSPHHWWQQERCNVILCNVTKDFGVTTLGLNHSVWDGGGIDYLQLAKVRVSSCVGIELMGNPDVRKETYII